LIDKEGIVWGVILSLAVQGLYNSLFFLVGGEIIAEWASATSAILSVVFVFLVFYLTGSLKKKAKTTTETE
jgi:hypothetical protein